jgi:hypothetical protein
LLPPAPPPLPEEAEAGDDPFSFVYHFAVGFKKQS